ncbi:MAG TPA: hypothetical protein DEF02_01950 [Clostridiales bacterium]|nr:hypothetical protein [Clostridiales bacterium]
MNKIGFDNDKYLSMQSEHIKERVDKFGGKLYLEFGGKLFDDYHASRVLPGFKPDSKLQMLLKMKDEAEIVIAINSDAIEQCKVRGDLGITYDMDVLRLIDAFREVGLYVGSVCLTQFKDQKLAKKFEKTLKKLGIKSYRHYPIANYPYDVEGIVSDSGLGKNEYIETTRSLVVVTAPGPGSGKMATCISQLYHDNKRGVKSGYAKFETFPIWNLPLQHMVNVAYEAATADLNDVNMIDPYHLEAYGVSTVNYNRDVEIFPVLKKMFLKIFGEEYYKSPTDMGVNMAGYCIIDDEACKEASKQEILRRYFKALCDLKTGTGEQDTVSRLEFLMSRLGINVADRKIVEVAKKKSADNDGCGAVALELADGRIVTGKNTKMMSASAACVFNAVKMLAGIKDKQKLISPYVIGPIIDLKTKILKEHNKTLTLEEALIALSICAASDANAATAMEQLPLLEGCDAHSTHMLFKADENPFRKLGVRLTCSPEFLDNTLFIE